ncbi:DUF1223 domain-containing protein [Planctomyces sp. SH-PL62]|uniref:DUF1223 domain-containing protein n=1 Tax=Planctomyces sp. SH-PL62 TaxID=1636152 RepID=UPI00078E89BA|nr:DUF1223 domain-containing protein [Planctomyces sp. SH-PL62]AMV36881.1 hypothetical protein VT85_05585 [Planctomyces sp. SH-PL62]
MRGIRIGIGTVAIALLVLCVGAASAQSSSEGRVRRGVLVELYTSQGCDMCPEAEAILGRLAEADAAIVPIAFHVDYFDEPWKDRFSDPLHSRRQAVYNEVYDKAKPASYGLYYTPMLMIDGEQSVNGRDRPAAEAAIRRARNKKPLATIEATLSLKPDRRSGHVEIAVGTESPRVLGRDLLVCAVVRENGVVTKVEKGENAGKTLIASHPARQTRHDFVTLKPGAKAVVDLPLELAADADPDRTRIAVFVQDRKTAVVHQALDLPWR